MSGASIPYHLRPHKSVDRRIFMDLLGRYERWLPLSGYVYVSMGAYPLEDHKLVFRLLGITRLIAFDFDEDIVARQIFNRPAETCHCIQKKSGELVSSFDEVLKDCTFSDASGAIVWLDYTAPNEVGKQVREFQTLLDGLRPGDILRVTLNAHPAALGSSIDCAGSHIPAPDLRAKRLEELKNRIGDYLPSWVRHDDMTEERLPKVLSASLENAALKAFPPGSGNCFTPLSIVRYADGHQMVSVTGAVVSRGDVVALGQKLDLENWPFASLSWDIVHKLVVPTLTIRERLFLERGIVDNTPSELIADLGFNNASDISMEDFIESYRKYYRFYPTLLTAEL